MSKWDWDLLSFLMLEVHPIRHILRLTAPGYVYRWLSLGAPLQGNHQGSGILSPLLSDGCTILWHLPQQ